MKNIIKIEKFVQKSENTKMRDDEIYQQTFTCCNKTLKAFFWEGWDCIENNTIDKGVLQEFKFCPFCGKALEGIEKLEKVNESR